MCETKFTFEQYCTFLGANVVMEEVFLIDGEKRIVCTNSKCLNTENGCKNKLRLLTE